MGNLLVIEMSNRSTQPFDIYRNGRIIDTVFYNYMDNVSSDTVKESLINHDGYPSDIEVKKVRL